MGAAGRVEEAAKPFDGGHRIRGRRKAGAGRVHDDTRPGIRRRAAIQHDRRRDAGSFDIAGDHHGPGEVVCDDAELNGLPPARSLGYHRGARSSGRWSGRR
jgi:hypothetical protein